MGENKKNDALTPNDEELLDSEISSFYSSFYKIFDLINLNNNYISKIENKLKEGNESIYNKTILETKNFDSSFLDILEKASPFFSKIILDPKKSIKYEQEIVNVEKARKINSDSVKYLASHTQYIRNINKNDEVIPSKLLTTYADEDLAIYENRFFKTTVNKIIKFLNKRLVLFKKNIESNKIDQIKYNNNFLLNKSDITIKFNVKVHENVIDNIQKSKRTISRTEKLLTFYKGLTTSEFLKTLAKAKDVVPPILKTNIILHNSNFKIVYNTWIFLEKYSVEPYVVDVKEIEYDDKKNVLEKDLKIIGGILFNELVYLRKKNIFNTIEKSSKEVKEVEPDKKELLRNENVNISTNDVEMENYTASEIFLSKAEKYFKDSLNNYVGNGITQNASAKAVIKEMIEIVNSLGPNVFSYNDNDLQEIMKDTKTLIKEEEERLKYLKLYREIKEEDLKNNIVLEQKAQDRLAKLNKVRIEELHKEETLKKEAEMKKIIQIKEEKERIEREALEHQNALREERDRKLKAIELQKELEAKMNHSYKLHKHHYRANFRNKKHLVIYNFNSNTNLFKKHSINSLKSKRDYSKSNRKYFANIESKTTNFENEIESCSIKAYNKIKKENKKQKKIIPLNIKNYKFDKVLKLDSKAEKINLNKKIIKKSVSRKKFDFNKIHKEINVENKTIQENNNIKVVDNTISNKNNLKSIAKKPAHKNREIKTEIIEIINGKKVIVSTGKRLIKRKVLTSKEIKNINLKRVSKHEKNI